MDASNLTLIVARHRAAAGFASYCGAAEQARRVLLDPVVDDADRELAELLAQAAHRAWLLGQAQFEAIARHGHHEPHPLHPLADRFAA